MLKVNRTGKYEEMEQELLLENPELELEVSERIKWFSKNPQDTRLDNHALTKPMEGKWAFSITDDLRIIYEWLSKTTVRFLAIGKHKKVYSKVVRHCQLGRTKVKYEGGGKA